ncbi:hypothetical protein, partial [Kocuria palustris]|uniref:hypothetical protein n=3 Tax=Kocuria palustris TaxID=71999 RepID=UPI0019D087A8
QPNKKLLELVSADNLAHYRVLKQQTINQPVSPGPRRSVPCWTVPLRHPQLQHPSEALRYITRRPPSGQLAVSGG